MSEDICYIKEDKLDGCPIFVYKDFELQLIDEDYFRGYSKGTGECVSSNLFREKFVYAEQDGLNHITVMWSHIVQAFAGNLRYLVEIRNDMECLGIIQRFMKCTLLYYNHTHESLLMEKEKILRVPDPRLKVLIDLNTLNHEACKPLLSNQFKDISNEYSNTYNEDMYKQLLTVSKDYLGKLPVISLEGVHRFLQEYNKWKENLRG